MLDHRRLPLLRPPERVVAGKAIRLHPALEPGQGDGQANINSGSRARRDVAANNAGNGFKCSSRYAAEPTPECIHSRRHLPHVTEAMTRRRAAKADHAFGQSLVTTCKLFGPQ